MTKFACLIVIISKFCLFQEEINFEYDNFIQGQKIDSIDLYIKGDIEVSALFPSIPKIDVGTLFKDENGDEYLGYLKEYVIAYASNPDSLLALAFYLKKQYNLKNSIYDQLLRQCIVLDENYNRAIFLLAELRFKKGGYLEDSYYLISLLKERLPRNKEINRVYFYFEEEIGEKPLKPESFKDYMFKDYYYIVED